MNWISFLPLGAAVTILADEYLEYKREKRQWFIRKEKTIDNKVIKTGWYEQNDKVFGFIKIDEKLISLTHGENELPILFTDIVSDHRGGFIAVGFVYNDDESTNGYIIRCTFNDCEYPDTETKLYQNIIDLMSITYDTKSDEFIAIGNCCEDNQCGVGILVFKINDIGDLRLEEMIIRMEVDDEKLKTEEPAESSDDIIREFDKSNNPDDIEGNRDDEHDC